MTRKKKQPLCGGGMLTVKADIYSSPGGGGQELRNHCEERNLVSDLRAPSQDQTHTGTHNSKCQDPRRSHQVSPTLGQFPNSSSDQG